MCQTAFSGMPSPSIRPILVTRRKIFPRSIPDAFNQVRNFSMTQPGTGTVRTCPALPFRSTMAQCSSRCSRCSSLRANGFVPAQTTGKQQRKKRAISLALQVRIVGSLPECEALLIAQPVAETDSEISYALYAANSRGQIGAQESAVCRFVGEAPDGTQSKVDGSRGKQAGLEVATIAENRRSV